MKKLFLASILSFTALCATEESVPDEKNIWDERGAYVKYGIGGVLLPILPSLGFGYYAPVGSKAVDFSVTLNTILLLNFVDIKLLVLPVVKERFQFGVGPTYSFIADIGPGSRSGALGLGFLFRRVKPYHKRFFQVELTLPILDNGVEFSRKWGHHAPGISIMWGHRF